MTIEFLPAYRNVTGGAYRTDIAICFFYFYCIDISEIYCIIIMYAFFMKILKDNGDFQMYRKKDESNRITIAGISLCAVALMLIVFTVMVYRGKRSVSEDLGGPVPVADDTQTGKVSETDVQSAPQETVSTDETSSAESSVESADVSSVDTSASEEKDILNPDYKSEFYMVVYTGNQTIVVYQKDESGEYNHTFHYMKCSTGALDTTPTKEGVYTIQKKEKWVTIGEKEFAQYGCLISKENNYYISTVSYSQKKAWTMIDGRYENIGKAATDGSIQLCARDAYWIYLNMPKGTQVHVVNRNCTDLKIKDLPKKLKKNGGWDPTDKWAKGNPYYS